MAYKVLTHTDMFSPTDGNSFSTYAANKCTTLNNTWTSYHSVTNKLKLYPYYGKYMGDSYNDHRERLGGINGDTDLWEKYYGGTAIIMNRFPNFQDTSTTSKRYRCFTEADALAGGDWEISDSGYGATYTGTRIIGLDFPHNFRSSNSWSSYSISWVDSSSLYDETNYGAFIHISLCSHSCEYGEFLSNEFIDNFDNLTVNDIETKYGTYLYGSSLTYMKCFEYSEQEIGLDIDVNYHEYSTFYLLNDYSMHTVPYGALSDRDQLHASVDPMFRAGISDEGYNDIYLCGYLLIPFVGPLSNGAPPIWAYFRYSENQTSFSNAIQANTRYVGLVYDGSPLFPDDSHFIPSSYDNYFFMDNNTSTPYSHMYIFKLKISDDDFDESGTIYDKYKRPTAWSFFGLSFQGTLGTISLASNDDDDDGSGTSVESIAWAQPRTYSFAVPATNEPRPNITAEILVTYGSGWINPITELNNDVTIRAYTNSACTTSASSTWFRTAGTYYIKAEYSSKTTPQPLVCTVVANYTISSIYWENGVTGGSTVFIHPKGNNNFANSRFNIIVIFSQGGNMLVLGNDEDVTFNVYTNSACTISYSGSTPWYNTVGTYYLKATYSSKTTTNYLPLKVQDVGTS